MIVNGYIELGTKELPTEYAVELNRLIQLEWSTASAELPQGLASGAGATASSSPGSVIAARRSARRAHCPGPTHPLPPGPAVQRLRFGLLGRPLPAWPGSPLEAVATSRST